ncbi:amidohydrolase family protein [Nonomuraea roseola]|uniref:Amidohydrolase family protein n=1 Tax=Nonomuraea roseola TaxID=46179 RepID=A0ABV5Q4V2_9ACTN
MAELTRRASLRAAVIVVAAGAAATTQSSRPAMAATPAQTVALTHATVIDATGAPPRPDTTVLITGERISMIGPSDRVPLPAGATVLDLTGKHVIPGLCDMHVHSIPSEEIAPPLYLANGITTVREMSGSPLLHQWRDRIEAETMLGPRMVIGSRIVDGEPTIGDPASFTVVDTETQARQAVRQAKAEGADFVKVYSRLGDRAYRAVADEARRLRIPFAGHCPDAVPLTTASRAGQRSIEHLYSTWYATSTQEAEIRHRLARLTIAQGDYVTWLHEIHRLEWLAATTYSRRKAGKVFAALARDHTHVVPTLSVYQVLDRPDEVDLTDERLRYVPAPLVAAWSWALENIIRAGRTSQESAQREQLFERRLAFADALRSSGVPVLAGTDGGDLPYVIPGFGLHDELALLVRSGFTPMQALQAATSRPARLLGLHHSQGTVGLGKSADLVILNADPLADIRNTMNIHAVVTRGRVISAEQRTRLLADVARAAAEQPEAHPAAAPRSHGCCPGLTLS